MTVPESAVLDAPTSTSVRADRWGSPLDPKLCQEIFGSFPRRGVHVACPKPHWSSIWGLLEQRTPTILETLAPTHHSVLPVCIICPFPLPLDAPLWEYTPTASPNPEPSIPLCLLHIHYIYIYIHLHTRYIFYSTYISRYILIMYPPNPRP